MLYDRNKGKIIIHVEKEDGKINSTMEYRGITKKSEIALTTLLVNFTSLSIEKGKDPKEIIDKHLAGIIAMIKKKDHL